MRDKNIHCTTGHSREGKPMDQHEHPTGVQDRHNRQDSADILDASQASIADMRMKCTAYCTSLSNVYPASTQQQVFGKQEQQ